MQQLQLQQAQIQREQARINDFWTDVGTEMAQIEPDKVCACICSRVSGFGRLILPLRSANCVRPKSGAFY